MAREAILEQLIMAGVPDAMAGAVLATIGIFFAIGLLILYLYTAFVYFTIARKLGVPDPWMAWVPILNMFYLPRIAGDHWAWGLLILFPPAYFVASLVWNWKIYERRGYPGPLALVGILAVVPFIAIIGGLIHLVIMGIVAWNDPERRSMAMARKHTTPRQTRHTVDTNVRRRR